MTMWRFLLCCLAFGVALDQTAGQIAAHSAGWALVYGAFAVVYWATIWYATGKAQR